MQQRVERFAHEGLVGLQQAMSGPSFTINKHHGKHLQQDSVAMRTPAGQGPATSAPAPATRPAVEGRAGVDRGPLQGPSQDHSQAPSVVEVQGSLMPSFAAELDTASPHSMVRDMVYDSMR